MPDAKTPGRADRGFEPAHRVAAAPPFYREELRRAGLDTALDRSQLSRLALTRRDELVRDQLDHLPYGRRGARAAPPVRAGVTGSGAALLVLTWTAADLARERAAGARVLGGLGITAGMRVANTLPGALATPGALLLGDVVEEIGGLDIPLGAVASAVAARAAWELFDRVHPDVLIVDATSAGQLFAAAPPASRSWWRGIVWLQADAGAVDRPALPGVVGFAGWQRTWLAVAEATSFVAHSCSAGRFHADDAVAIEIVDPEAAAALPAPDEGAIALTPLGLDPLRRYLSGLRGRLVGGCPCGGQGVVIELAG